MFTSDVESGTEAPVDQRKYLLAIPITLVLNSCIALFLWLLLKGHLQYYLVYSHAIGWSVLGVNWAISRLDRRRRLAEWAVISLATPTGCLLGFLLGAVILREPGPELLRSLSISAIAGLLFGPGISHYIATRARLAKGVERLREEQLAREESARRLAEAELKLLQAQIEPHFLFNTLSNVVQLVDADPQRARRMLLNLTSYLRGSLRRTRAGATTLGEELDLVRAYLEIQAVRMGSRLTWRITCPDGLQDLTLPPLLVQPLVENAVRHAIEPRPAGGAVEVSASRQGDELTLEIRDDGPGLDPRRPPGVGLTNVRERVRAVTGGRGSLTLRPLDAGGICARIVFPLTPAPAPAREGA